MAAEQPMALPATEAKNFVANTPLRVHSGANFGHLSGSYFWSNVSKNHKKTQFYFRAKN